MEKGRHITVLIAVVLIAAATGHAEMTPISSRDAGPVVSLPLCDQADARAVNVVNSSGVLPGSLPVASDTTAGGTDPTQAVQIATDGQSSLHLCLYALLSMGLCKSLPIVKKISLGIVPQWYHEGGPLQIGHSHAISPDCLDSAPVCCFIQPDVAVNNPMHQYRQGSVVSLWRTSQYTPAVLASRAPPSDAHELVFA